MAESIPEELTNFFSKQDIKELGFQFKSFDADGDGSITSKELKVALTRIGEKNVTEAQINEYIKEVDENMNGNIEYVEFLKMVKKMREGKATKLGNVVAKSAKVTSVAGEAGTHSYTDEETIAFSDYINSVLATDPHLQDVLPMKQNQLFEAVKDGVLLCKLINACVPDTIDERVINVKKKKNPWEVNENQILAINSAKGIGCSTVNIGPKDLIDGRAHIVLGLVWQIIKIGLLQDINLKEHPELVRLLKEGETLQDLLKLSPEELLLRWVNYQLEQAGSKKRVKNFTSDIKDSEAYTVLLKQIAPNNQCDDSPLKETDPTQRAEKMLQQADKIQCRKFVGPKDVVNGNPKLNLAFVANLFNNYPALAPINKEDYDFAELLDFDSEGTREERAFRFWIQSLGLDCNNLFEDMKDGVLLLKVFDKVQPGIVDWKKVNLTPKLKFHKLENTNLAVELAKQLKFSTVNLSGVDIHDGNKKLILGLIWQLMRQNLLNILKDLGGGKALNDEDIVKWANAKVEKLKIDSFKDPSLRTGAYLCWLCHAVNSRSCNPEMITPGESEKDAEQNAKYAISVARKIGATVFLLWEDIVEVKPKMILSFVGALMQVDLQGGAK